ncbi:MAG: LTA synthase family protein [Magnetococcus sp. DMHC-6]
MQRVGVIGKNVWQSLFANIKIFFICLIFLETLRWIFIFSLFDSLGPTFTWADFARVSFYGLHYDLKLAFLLFFVLTFFVTLPIFFGMFRLAQWVRWGVLTGFVFLTLFLIAASREFFLEYNETFDIRIFDGIRDDHMAILQTMIHAYHLYENLAVVFLSTFFYALVGHRSLLKIVESHFIQSQRFLGFNRPIIWLLLVLAFVGINFTLAFGPLEAVDREAKRFHSKVLNAAIIPGPIALYKAAYEYKRKLKAYDASLYDLATIQKALVEIAPGVKGTGVEDYFHKEASGQATLVQKPKQVFVLLMERYDSWPLLPKYASLQVSNGLKSLIQEGVHFKNFLPGSTTTMPSLQTLLMGLPFIDLDAQHFTETIFPGGIAHPMAALGYKTRFFYGGYLGWSQVGLVAKSQGFDQVFGADVAMTHYVARNEWGIDDQSLFDFVAQTVAADPSPSFNFILTSTNHPPYDLDLKAFHVPVDEIGRAVDKMGFSNGTKESIVNRLGHLWYSDQAMTTFVRAIHEKDPSALFAITGDHFSRAHLKLETSLYEQSSVPLVLFGPKELQKRGFNANLPGSHLDIAPTLVELLAPKGFAYVSMGRSMVGGQGGGPYGFGSGGVILTQEYIAKLESQQSAQTVDRGVLMPLPPENRSYIATIHALKSVAWWRMIHGNPLQ